MAKHIMIQGTASDVGKSLMAAAIGRIYTNEGLRVFPFKSQNMALNSYITKTGAEMARAQVVQAKACRREPDVLMNPILMKPSQDAQSQIIIKGQVYGDLDARDYHELKPQLKPMLREVMDQLDQENDLIVLEGAGSPAEINLNDHDIVNMGMAEIADSPVVLVADIDRGGVFASIYGTIALLKEQGKRIKGIIINKFRGDVSLLDPGIEQIEALTGVKVIGVVPYLPHVIESEDSCDLHMEQTSYDASKALDVCVIALEWIANFTDLNSLSLFEDVSLRYAKQAKQVGQPDLIIIPGTANPPRALKDLEDRGLASAIQAAVSKGSHLIALGAGQTLMGQSLRDQDGHSYPALGIFPYQASLTGAHDVYQSHCQTTCPLDEAGGEDYSLAAYEVRTYTIQSQDPLRPFAQVVERNGASFVAEEGYCLAGGRLIASNLHGLFDNTAWTYAYLQALAEKKGVKLQGQLPQTYAAVMEDQFQELAQHVLNHIDKQALDRIIEGEE
ncbi:cobyric acid synthase [Aerococcus urinae]|uniref:Cobyric acid synthase n=1 Tax=Aerococcus urinae TaxID=1376 RepID=A0A0X8FDA7_9LACT|nr:cobyric acid synthase [Aerococcus urinae]AMB95240.1 hypothetical protein AWM73_01345 [Aerococcus urinae]MCY3031961.1 cobyric acid synthase [Aerococcus urinae]MCY3037045.1 cobyric acid synthase [Aerococcus urinae]MCY3046721.1 cobyric acid synthase [Aerococcus urinae]MCY3047463.1 cobyric acid synthase [Aerococcus urinae]